MLDLYLNPLTTECVNAQTIEVVLILNYTGMCHSNGSFFHKKSLNICPIFKKISLNMGLLSWLSQKFQVLWWTSRNCEKFLKIGTFFSQKRPLKMGRSFECRVVHLRPNQI